MRSRISLIGVVQIYGSISMFKENALSASITFAEGMNDIKFTIKIVKWIAVIAAAIGAAAAVIMEQGCTHKHYLKANGIKIDTIEVSTSTKIK